MRIAHDVLQKVYPVGSMMMAAFAGSVEIGFQMVADLKRCFTAKPGYIWEPKAAAWHWRTRGRRMFRQTPLQRPQLGASVVLVGVSPEKNGLFQWARCIRMRSPNFDLEIIRPLTWASIGTGTQHQNAAEYTSDFPARFHEFYFQNRDEQSWRCCGCLIKHARYYWLLLAESHLTRRLFGAMLRRIWALPVPT